mmetsp:Transcript_4285/g.12351  ORF Transcript_4285/g.12351 Transcript_4285/m.12351 type:complete len:613 (-) Transcript_4285:102-1940(-)
MSRLYLHGRSSTGMLLSKLDQILHRGQQESLNISSYSAASSAPVGDVTTLLLSNWNFEAMDLTVLQKLIEFLRNRAIHLENVTLQNCAVIDASREESIRERHVVMAEILSSSPTLTIRFDKQQPHVPRCILDGFLQSAKLPPSTRRTKHLKLQGVNLTKPLLDSLRIAVPPWTLECFEISSRITLSELDRKRASVFGVPSNYSATEQTIRSFCLLLRQHSLQTLKLDSCHIPDEYLSRILQSVRRDNLKTLSIRGNLAQEKTMQVLADWLLDESCHLETLSLDWQRQYGCLGNCSSFSIQMPFIAKVIIQNQSLQNLSISENELSDDEMKLLCSALRRNKGLKILDLRDCLIRTQGFHYLSKILPDLKLSQLNLSGRQRVPGKTLKQILVKPVFQNMYLQDLVLPHVESKTLEWVLEWNRVGRRVLVEQEPTFPVSLWPQLLSRANVVGEHASDREPVRHAASAIYYILRERGFEILSQHYAEPKAEMPRKEYEISEEVSQWASTKEIQRISPCSSCEDEDVEESSAVFATSNIRHYVETSGEIELQLEDSSAAMSSGRPVIGTDVDGSPMQPSPLLVRPRLVSSKISSSVPATPCEARRPLATVGNRMLQC